MPKKNASFRWVLVSDLSDDLYVEFFHSYNAARDTMFRELRDEAGVPEETILAYPSEYDDNGTCWSEYGASACTGYYTAVWRIAEIPE